MSEKTIKIAKCVSLCGFMVLLVSTYYLRSEIITLNHLRFQSSDVRSQHELKEYRDSYKDRVEDHKMALKQYELEQKHYKDMKALYESDYDAYVKRLKDKYRPPNLPESPQPPEDPEVEAKLYEIDAEFRNQQFQYFSSLGLMNWLSAAAALALAGELVFLIFFDVNASRLYYVIVLVLSFIFMIGPSFHSIMTLIAGLLESPGV